MTAAEHALLSFGFDSGATFSPCRTWRYHLWRSWGDREHRVAFIGLNPSTADETVDDPTIRKCIGFAKRWGFGAYDMLNLFGWRSTDPMGLLEATNPVGSENNAVIAEVCRNAHRIVFAWGRHNARVRALVQKRLAAAPWLAVPATCEVGTLGRAQDGSPRHPLMLAYDTRFERGNP